MRTESPASQLAEPTTTSEAREVVGWRERQLRAAGFELGLARELARECAVDLHTLIELVERECPPALAARILAPLPGERKPC